MLGRREIHVSGGCQSLAIGNHLAVHAKTCDPTVGIDVQPHVCPAITIRDAEPVLNIAAKRRAWQDFTPPGRGSRERGGIWMAAYDGRVDRTLRRVVAREETRIDE